LAYKPILPEPARSVARKQVAIWPSVPQAQTSRLSSVFVPFSVFQPILNLGLRLPASRLIPLRRLIDVRSVLAVLLSRFASQAPHNRLSLRQASRWVMRRRPLLGNVPLPLRRISVWSIRSPPFQVRAKFGFNNAPGIFSLRSFNPALQGGAIFGRFEPACRWMNIHLDNFCSRDRPPFE